MVGRAPNAPVIGFGLFFYVTCVREEWNTDEDGFEHRCVLLKHTRVFTTKQEGAVGRGCVMVVQTSALALSGTPVLDTMSFPELS